MSRYDHKFEVYEMGGGTYTSRKLPKWHFNHVDVLEYMQMLEEDTLLPDQSSANA